MVWLVVVLIVTRHIYGHLNKHLVYIPHVGPIKWNKLCPMSWGGEWEKAIGVPINIMIVGGMWFLQLQGESPPREAWQHSRPLSPEWPAAAPVLTVSKICVRVSEVKARR